MIDIRLPNITEVSTDGRLRQMQSYMFQLAQQLQYAMNTMEAGGQEAHEIQKVQASAPETQEQKAQNAFNEIKSLIIKSADIVKSYSEEISNMIRLSGEYAAEAHFPDGSASFVENTTAQVGANSSRIEALFTDTQTIRSNVGAILDAISTDGDTTTILTTNAWAKIGKIGEKNPAIPYMVWRSVRQTR